jgi:hypothetical protein
MEEDRASLQKTVHGRVERFDCMKRIISAKILDYKDNLTSPELRDESYKLFMDETGSSQFTAAKYFKAVMQDLSGFVDSAAILLEVIEDQRAIKQNLGKVASAEIFVEDKDGNKKISEKSGQIKVNAFKAQSDCNKLLADIVMKNSGNDIMRQRNAILHDRNRIENSKPAANINIENVENIDMEIMAMLKQDRIASKKLEEDMDELLGLSTTTDDLVDSSGFTATVQDDEVEEF